LTLQRSESRRSNDEYYRRTRHDLEWHGHEKQEARFSFVMIVRIDCKTPLVWTHEHKAFVVEENYGLKIPELKFVLYSKHL